MMLVSARARRCLRYMRGLGAGRELEEILETAFCERIPSDGTEYPMDRVLDGLMEMHRAGLWRNGSTGPGDVVDRCAADMLALMRFARCADTVCPDGAYDGILCMDGAPVEGRR